MLIAGMSFAIRAVISVVAHCTLVAGALDVRLVTLGLAQRAVTINSVVPILRSCRCSKRLVYGHEAMVMS